MSELVSAFTNQTFCSFKSQCPGTLHPRRQIFHKLLSLASFLNVCSLFVSGDALLARRRMLMRTIIKAMTSEEILQ